MNKWILKDGFTVIDYYTSFPYAFKAMCYLVENAKGKGLNHLETIKKLLIVSPLKDAYGDCRKYNYAESIKMAETLGLLDDLGKLDKRKLKKDRLCS